MNLILSVLEEADLASASLCVRLNEVGEKQITFFLAFNKITDSASDLKLCSHLVPEHGARAVCLSLGTNVNAT